MVVFTPPALFATVAVAPVTIDKVWSAVLMHIAKPSGNLNWSSYLFWTIVRRKQHAFSISTTLENAAYSKVIRGLW